MIHREAFLDQIRQYFKIFKVVAILGPRQCGKSTLSKQYTADETNFHYFDLERPRDIARLKEDEITLSALDGLIVIDEIQRRPELFPTLRYLVDNTKQKYLILGSASRDLIHQSSETLAGRIGYIELPPISLFELPGKPDMNEINKLWLRGGFPDSFLAETDQESTIWRENYIMTFLERDLAVMNIDVDPVVMGKFWQMLAHYHGQTLNSAAIGNSLGITHKTVQRYIEILEGTFMVRQLRPWFENIEKRQVKSSKLYIRDSGLLHNLLLLPSLAALQGHPALGASWEGFAMEEIIRRSGSKDCYFWSTQNQSEIDLIIFKDGKRFGFEFKYTSSPKRTKSIHLVMKDLKLDHVHIITPAGVSYPLGPNISVNHLLAQNLFDVPEEHKDTRI
jgi:predicted AAA+ superfamily ATPase